MFTSNHSADSAKSLGFPNAKGAVVVSVVRNSAADLGGIKALDVILDFDGQPVVKASSLSMANLARLYEVGKGVQKDSNVAADWVFRALKADDPTAKADQPYVAKNLASEADSWSPAFWRALQQHLKDAGVYQGPIEGRYGPSTKAALEAIAKH